MIPNQLVSYKVNGFSIGAPGWIKIVLITAILSQQYPDVKNLDSLKKSVISEAL